MRALLALLALVGGCGGGEPAVTECAKVLCEADEYCLAVYDGVYDSAAGPVGELPSCTAAPAACDGVPSCDCLPECTSCSEDNGVHCEIALP